MKSFHSIVAITALALTLSACSNKKETIPDTPAAELFATAQKDLQEGGYRAAIKQLEALDSRYPFGAYAQQTQLDLIYAYYKADEYPLAQAAIDRFIRLNPTHANIDWVLYMRGLTSMAIDENILQSFFGIDRADRDPEYALTAFQDFQQLLRNYPTSAYANDAQRRLFFLKNRLAKYDLAVAEHYLARQAYVAVVNRGLKMLQDYPETLATRQVLPLMQKAYKAMQLPKQAAEIGQLIAANPIKS